MTEIAKDKDVDTDEFADKLSDEALDREGAARYCSNLCGCGR